MIKTSRSRRVLAGTLGLAVTASLVAIAGPASAAGTPLPSGGAHETSTACNPNVYKDNWHFTHTTQQPVITSLQVKNLPAHGKYSGKVTEVHKNTVAWGVTVSGSGSAKSGFVVSLFAHVNVTITGKIKYTSTSTTTKSVTTTTTISNPTNHSQAYVFFHGVMKGAGQWRLNTCQKYRAKVDGGGPTGNDWVARVTYYAGRWQGLAIPTSGPLGCGQGTKGLNAVSLAALRTAC